MKIEDFKLERYFAKHEFSAKYLLCASDCESFEVSELIPKEKVNKLLSLRLGYTETQGSPLLREEISKLFKAVTPDEIVVSGTAEGIFISMNSLLSSGDKVIVQFPNYQSLYELPKSIGCKVTKWESELKDGKWYCDLNFLRKNAKNTRLIVISSPHNPTGHHFTKEEFEEIMEIAEENKCYVFSDEMYRMLEYDPKDRLPTGTDLYEKCISLSGMSKTFGMPGLRIGWLSIRDKEMREKVLAFKDYTTICSSSLSEFVALEALKKKEMVISRNLGIIKQNLGLLDTFFKKHQDLFSWTRPVAGPISFVRIKFDMNSESFCDQVVRERGIMLMPSTKFDYGDKHFRIGFGRRNMPEALNLFEEYVSASFH